MEAKITKNLLYNSFFVIFVLFEPFVMNRLSASHEATKATKIVHFEPS